MAGPVTARAIAAAAIVVAFAVAWVGAGSLARRYQVQRLPPVPALDGIPEPAREAVRAADARARSAPGAASFGALGRAYYAAQLAAPAIAAFSAAEAAAPDAWTWTYHRALVLEERQDDAAGAALQRTTQLAPRFAPAWYRLGERHFKQGRLDEAAAAYAEAAKAPPVDPFRPAGLAARTPVPVRVYAAVGLARVALEKGDRGGALRQAESVLGEVPRFAPAVALLRQARGAEAEAAAPAARAFAPPSDPVLDQTIAGAYHSDVLLKHAGIAARAGDDGWREFLARRALAANPTDLNVLMEMAGMLQDTGRPADALEYLRQHEALAPGDHHTLVQQGRVLADLGRVVEAEAVLRRAVAVRDTTAEYNLGTVLAMQDRWPEARARFERALEIDPFNTRAMNNLAIGLDRHGEPGALAMFERAIAVTPDRGEFYVNYGSALIGQGRLDDAIGALAIGIRLEPRAPNAHNNLGIALAQQRRLDDARQAFERALQLDPGHVNARSNLDQTLRVLRRTP